MLSAGDLIASFDFMTDFNGINRHFPNSFYPAGIYEADKMEYKYGEKSVEYPSLTLSENIYDGRGHSIQAGFYTAVLSYDRRSINLYQSGILKARVRVLKLTEEMRTSEEINKEAELENNVKKAIEKKKLKKQRKAEEELKAYKETQAADTYAVIEDTGEGYYRLKYKCFGQKAEGIIPK